MSSALPKFLLVLVAAAAAVVWHLSDAFPTGAPRRSCRDFKPQHRTEPQPGPSPYVINVTRRTGYIYRRRFDVTISSPTNATFRGFILVAKRANGGTMGTFYRPPRYSTMKLVCDGRAMSHSINRVHSNVTASWRGPWRHQNEQITFTATVVQTFRTFWMNVESDPVDLGA